MTRRSRHVRQGAFRPQDPTQLLTRKLEDCDCFFNILFSRCSSLQPTRIGVVTTAKAVGPLPQEP